MSLKKMLIATILVLFLILSTITVINGRPIDSSDEEDKAEDKGSNKILEKALSDEEDAGFNEFIVADTKESSVIVADLEGSSGYSGSEDESGNLASIGSSMTGSFKSAQSTLTNFEQDTKAIQEENVEQNVGERCYCSVCCRDCKGCCHWNACKSCHIL